MDAIYESLAEATSTTTASHEDDVVEFWKVEAEEHPQLCQRYQVTYIPTFLMVDTNGVVVDRIEGSNDPARLTMAVRSFLVRQEQPSKPQSPIGNVTQTMEPPPMKQSTDIDIGALTKRSPIILFMKGLPSHPRCGFSRQMCLLLDKYNVSYDAYDILTNEEVRQGLKVYSDWPTYPQLYVQGEFIGGLDICKELDESGELMKILSISQ
jgi:Grx4 family monothiol glutaredoxin